MRNELRPFTLKFIRSLPVLPREKENGAFNAEQIAVYMSVKPFTARRMLKEKLTAYRTTEGDVVTTKQEFDHWIDLHMTFPKNWHGLN